MHATVNETCISCGLCATICPEVFSLSQQDGRAHGPSVVRCGETAEEIEEGLRKALSPEQKAIATRRENPYAKPDTLRLMTKAIAEADLSPRMQKKFYDL